MERFWKHWKKSWYWLFFAAVVLLTVYMDVYIARFVLDGDASEVLNRAQVIAEQNDLFTRDVYMTTEVGLLDITAVFSVFFYFTSDWTLVRILGTVFLQAYYAASYLYLCRQARISRASAVFSAGLLLLPFSVSYARVVLYHVYYILYIANAFWILGLTIRLLRAAVDPGLSRKDIPHALLLAGMWVFVGCNGIRHMLILGFPMLAYAAFQFIRTLDGYRLENGRLVGGQMPLVKTEAVCLMLMMTVCCACFMAGFLINIEVLVPYYGLKNFSSTFYLPFMSPSRYTEILNGFLTAMGVRYSVLSMAGVRGLSLIAALFIFGCLCVRAFKNCRERTDLSSRLFSGMLAATLVTSTFVFLFDSAARLYELYFVPVLVWLFPVFAAEWDRFRDSRTPLGQRLLILAVCVCLLFQSAYSVLFIRTKNAQMDQWDGLTYKNMDAVDYVDDCVAFMQENGYTHGLTDYWYANVMREVSDGELFIAPVKVVTAEGFQLQFQKWGTSKTLFQPEKLPEQIVIFMKHEHCDEFKRSFPQVPLVFEGWQFCGYLADTNLLNSILTE